MSVRASAPVVRDPGGMRCRALFAAVVLPLLLQSCAGARVQDVALQTGRPSTPAPAALLVVVEPDPTTDVSIAELADLRSDVVRELLKSRLPARIYVDSSRATDAALLRVLVTRSDPGNRSKRLLIGFGSGQAKIETSVSLELPLNGDGRNAYSFTTAGNSGYKPGLVAPAGAAVATASVVRFAVGGAVNLATNPKDGLTRPTQKTAQAIVAQVMQYYRSAGWLG